MKTRGQIVCLLLTLSMTIVFSDLYAARSVRVSKKGERRIALVIGNYAYRMGRLKNPRNDARDMARVLKKNGFRVRLLLNANRKKMERAIYSFGKSLRGGGVGLFYYAGHGMQVKGINYLIPIGADINAEDEIKFDSVDANRVLAKMESAGNRMNIMFLDACRDNPFKRSFRGSAKGLAQMDAPRGTLLSFATAPGKTAADGKGRNGLFTSHLLREMRRKNVELDQLMKNVTRGVVRDSGGKQVPWRLSSTTGNFYFKGGGTGTPTPPREPLAIASGSIQTESGGKGQLRITTEPETADIYIDHVFSGNSPLNIRLRPGIYTIEAGKKRYKKESRRVHIFEDADLDLTLILDKTGSTLSLTSRPASAEVYIDQGYSGETPLDIKGLTPGGRIRVRISKKGYRDWSRIITISDRPNQRVEARLSKKHTGMVLIPAGEFQMGSASGDKDEKPVHTVYLDQYLIDTHEVTVAEYKRCVSSGRCEIPGTGGYFNWGKSGRNNHPINGVNWKNVKNYYQFVNKRLPSEAEWERAATWKNGHKYKYPSGENNLSCADAVIDDGGDGCGKDRTWPVGSKPREINGTYDMAGNVWEWVADWYGKYPARSQRVFRGGGWSNYASTSRGANRNSYVPSFLSDDLGFRCASSP